MTDRFFLKKLILFIAFCCSLATGQGQKLLDQKVSLICNNCSPEAVLVQLSTQIGVNVVFNDRFFENCPRADFSFSEKPLSEVLTKITACGRVGFRVVENQIVLFKRTQKYRLAGYVSSAETGERLIGAVVKTLPAADAGATANEFGFFSLQLLEGEHRISVSFVGFKTEILDVTLSGDRFQNVSLKPNSSLPEVVVSDFQPVADSARGPGNRHVLPIEDLKNLPMPGGEPDVLRMLAYQPGIQTGVDGLGGLHIRGGNADQNLILLDDVPVYNPSHALGLLSIFNTGSLSDVRVWKGNFPARYGGRASSVVDVRTRDGNFQNYRGAVSAGLFASTLEAEGPLEKGVSSFLLGGRFTYLDPWVRAFSRRQNLLTFPEDNSVRYRFYDFNGKINMIFSEKDKGYFSFYRGADIFHDQFEQVYYVQPGFFRDVYRLKNDWGNAISAFRWNHIFRSNLFSNTTLTFSRFDYRSSQFYTSSFYRNSFSFDHLTNIGKLYQTRIRDWSAKSDFTWFFTNRMTLRWGASFTRHFFQPGAFSVDFLLPGQTPSAIDSLESVFLKEERLRADETQAYFETDWRIEGGWHLQAGANGSIFTTTGAKFANLLPRVQLQKRLGRHWNAWAGYHQMSQNVHQIGSFNISLPFELWVPSTAKVRPELVWQANAGFGWQSGGWSWQAEGYWKVMDRVLTFLGSFDALYVGEGSENSSGWEDRIATGKGWSRGAELVVEKTKGKLRGMASYTLSWSWRQFPDINQGNFFPFRFDRRHDFKINLQHRFSRRFQADLSWVFATGNPITLTGVKYEHLSASSGNKRTVFVFTEVNGYRLPNFHRLDVSASYFFKTKKWQHSLQAGLYNAYNRQNPFFVALDVGSNVKGKAIQYTLLPLFPVLRYEVKF